MHANFKRLLKVMIPVILLTLFGCCGDVRSYYLGNSAKMEGLTVSGFSDPEAFGRWSIADKVTLDFSQELPEEFVLTLHVGAAFGPNVGKTFLMEVGGKKINFDGPRDKDVNQPKVYRFELTAIPAGTKRITITVPQPSSPKDIGLGEDQRKLGFALNRIFITSLNPSLGCEMLGH